MDLGTHNPSTGHLENSWGRKFYWLFFSLAFPLLQKARKQFSAFPRSRSQDPLQEVVWDIQRKGKGRQTEQTYPEGLAHSLGENTSIHLTSCKTMGFLGSSLLNSPVPHKTLLNQCVCSYWSCWFYFTNGTSAIDLARGKKISPNLPHRAHQEFNWDDGNTPSRDQWCRDSTTGFRQVWTFSEACAGGQHCEKALA